jgi:hypothetical protein
LHPVVFADGLKLMESCVRDENLTEFSMQQRELVDGSKVEEG